MTDRASGTPRDRTAPAPPAVDAWSAAVGWDASAKLRRARALAMTDDERLRVVEEMIGMAVASGAFRAKRPHAPR
jgi:hypothetical protein